LIAVHENILVIRLKSIGDVVFTLPAVHVLRENFPNAKITFLTSKESAVLLRGFRDVDETIALDRATLRSGNPLKILPEFFGLVKKLRAGKFSLAVDFQSYGETAWLARLTSAAQRWGTIYSGRKWAYTRGFTRGDGIHPADWNLSLLRQSGLKIGEIKNEFALPDDALAAAKNFFHENKLDAAKPTLFIQPLTSSPEKNWPLENYLAVARHWRSGGGQIIFGGGPIDRVALQSASAENFCVAAGAPLLVSAGLARLSSLLLGGDTGLSHLAVAMGRRVVLVMRDNTAGWCVPFRHPEWVVVPPRPIKISDVTVESVIAVVESAFNEPVGNVSC
jgi:ADP-heptose:LPS heptosyltransferase